MGVKLAAASGGSIELVPTNTASNFTVTVPDSTGTMVLTSTATVLTGAVTFFAMSTTPSGWLKANGAAISRTTYADLFTAIGTVFGVGDGSTTFNVPDMRGYFPRGWVDNGSVDSGRAFGSTQIDGFKAHTHTTTPYAPGGAAAYIASAYNSFFDSASGVSGSTGGTETRPYNVAFLACIKY